MPFSTLGYKKYEKIHSRKFFIYASKGEKYGLVISCKTKYASFTVRLQTELISRWMFWVWVAHQVKNIQNNKFNLSIWMVDTFIKIASMETTWWIEYDE